VLRLTLSMLGAHARRHLSDGGSVVRCRSSRFARCA
jgi:hypothetical protein